MDDDFRINSFIISNIFIITFFIKLFSSENEIDIKDTEKSFITSALGSFTKNNKI